MNRTIAIEIPRHGYRLNVERRARALDRARAVIRQWGAPRWRHILHGGIFAIALSVAATAAF